MEPIVLTLSGILALLGISALVITLLKSKSAEVELEKKNIGIEREKEKIISDAREQGEKEAQKIKQKQEKEHETALQSLRKKESEVEKRYGLVDGKMEKLDLREKKLVQREGQIVDRERSYELKEGHLETLLEKERAELSRVASLTEEQARKILLTKLEDDVEKEAKNLIIKRLNEAKEEAKTKSQEILVDAIGRICREVTAENTTSSVHLPKDDIKGKIIGREGRNIRAFESVTGVDVIIDETPEVITVSAFDAYRREVAVRCMKVLIKDGRIHPQRIEEVYEKTLGMMDEETAKMGEHALFEAGFSDIHPDLMKLFGRLRYRLSYGQNQLDHSLQVGELAGYIAQELGLDRKLAARAALFHDIGKSIDQGQDGTHVQLGVDLARKYGESEEVINSIVAHHEGEEVTTIYTYITRIADAVSAVRPGARRENTEKYIERMTKLEEVATAQKGVEKAFAMRAGRELRVCVIPTQVNDEDALIMARRIAKTVEKEVTYPGEVKVTVVRETRFVEIAH